MRLEEKPPLPASQTPALATAAAPALTRRLGLDSATALLVGQVIGVGIFLAPATMAKSLGSPLLVLVVWLFTGAAAFCGALCFAELATRFPEAGGPYVYLREAWGGLPAFLYGWKCLLVMDPGLTAALSAGFAAYVGAIVPLSPLGLKIVGAAAVLALAAANLRGTQLAAGVIRLLTAGKLYLLGLLVICGFVSRLGDWSHFVPVLARRAGSAPLVPALAGAVVVAFFSFGGWWEMSKIAGEVREPSETIPRAFALGIGLVTLVYILTSAVFLYLVPIESVGSGETFAAQAATVLIGPPGAHALAALVALCIISSLATITTLCPRVYYAMARDGSFFAAVGRLDPRTGTPVRAIIVQTVLACLLLMVGTFDQIVAYFIFVTVAFLGLTLAGLFVIRRRVGSAPGFATPGFPVPALVFLGYLVAVLVLLAAASPMQAALGAGVVALGAPACYLKRRFA